MHRVCSGLSKHCGQAAEISGPSCGSAYIMCTVLVVAGKTARVKPKLSTQAIRASYTLFPQSNNRISSLLFKPFSPPSTRLITTTTMYIN
jgi:hypothetical protein